MSSSGLAGAGADAVQLLRQAQRRHPNDFWINLQLALAMTRQAPPRWEEAVGYYRAALALRPNSAGVYLNLGVALQAGQRLMTFPEQAGQKQSMRLQQRTPPDACAANRTYRYSRCRIWLSSRVR